MRRRQFTQFIALLAGGVAAPVFAAAIPTAGKSAAGGSAAACLSRDFFEAQLGKEFSVGKNGTRKLRLKAVESACCHNPREQFHAIFEVSPGTPLEEGIYVLERSDRPRMGLFMTRSDRGTRRQQLVATVNLQTSA